jgi:hypothetical protein
MPPTSQRPSGKWHGLPALESAGQTWPTTQRPIPPREPHSSASDRAPEPETRFKLREEEASNHPARAARSNEPEASGRCLARVRGRRQDADSGNRLDHTDQGAEEALGTSAKEPGLRAAHCRSRPSSSRPPSLSDLQNLERVNATGTNRRPKCRPNEKNRPRTLALGR